MRFSGNCFHRIFASTKTTTKRAYENAKHPFKDSGRNPQPAQSNELHPNGRQQQRPSKIRVSRITGGNSLVPAALAVNVDAAAFLLLPTNQKTSLENKKLLSNPVKPNYPMSMDTGKRAGAK
jgi:hypothetical protein